jgi:hypothetical protein
MSCMGIEVPLLRFASSGKSGCSMDRFMLSPELLCHPQSNIWLSMEERIQSTPG